MVAGVAFLASKQAANGSFMGQAGSTITPFRPTRRHPTNFFTALITWCLRDVSGSEAIRRQAVTFLRQQQSLHGSWNYWQGGSTMAKQHPYPDDLDDTACALLALHSFDPMLLDGAVLAQLAKLLIVTETATGGPYRTWLVDAHAMGWQDVDVVVNANVGRVLAINQVQLPGLNQFLDKAIATNRLNSPYYVGMVPALYFLSSWYQGSQLPKLKQLVDEQLAAASTNSLQLAMLTTAASNLGLATSSITAAQSRLVALLHEDHWPAEALYIDPRLQGQQYYAGSTALTTAFALEALASAVPQSATTTSRRHPPNRTARLAIAESRSLPMTLGTAYRHTVKQLAASDKDQQITGMANLVAAAYNLTIDKTLLDHLNLGSLNGWIAYSIYDDFLDEQGQANQLGVAHYALRQSLQHFALALPNSAQFSELVSQAFATMDTANLWEVTHARAQQRNDTLNYGLPNYGLNSQLAERSWGHSLAAIGVVLASRTVAAMELKYIHKFFHHFLIARQLNDDAHDWEADLQAGHLSTVVCLLLKEQRLLTSVNVQTELSDLQKTFWQSTIPEVTKLLFYHSDQARQALTKSGMTDPAPFLSWLERLEASAQQAVNQSRETQKFIASYQR